MAVLIITIDLPDDGSVTWGVIANVLGQNLPYVTDAWTAPVEGEFGTLDVGDDIDPEGNFPEGIGEWTVNAWRS